jgi:hypothetical protein
MGHDLLSVQHESNKLNAITFHEKKPLYEGNIIAVALYASIGVLSDTEISNLNWQPDEKERHWFDNIQGMPTLAKWIEDYKEHIESVVFYAAQPGAIINHHYGVDTAYQNIRIHLCLTADPDCWFDIENERHSWIEGDIFGFEDASFFHGIKHNGVKPRIVLAIDIHKSIMKEHAINWPNRPFIPRKERVPPKIINW